MDADWVEVGVPKYWLGFGKKLEAVECKAQSD